MDPFAGEIFSACLGGGAHVNFAPMRVGEEATGEEAVVVTGYGALAESADAMIKGMKVRVISQSPSLPSVRVHITKYPNTNQLLTNHLCPSGADRLPGAKRSDARKRGDHAGVGRGGAAHRVLRV